MFLGNTSSELIDVQVSDAVAMSESIQEAARILRDTVEKGEELKASSAKRT
jgi:hypothetical protein